MTPTASTPTAGGPLTTLPLSSTFAVSHLFGGQSLERLRFVWLKRYPSLFFGPASRSVCRGRKRDRLWMHSATIGGAHVSLLMLLILAEQTVLALVTGHLRSRGHFPLSPDHSCVCVWTSLFFFWCHFYTSGGYFGNSCTQIIFLLLAWLLLLWDHSYPRIFCDFIRQAEDIWWRSRRDFEGRCQISKGRNRQVIMRGREGGSLSHLPTLSIIRTVRFTDRGPTPKTNCF